MSDAILPLLADRDAALVQQGRREAAEAIGAVAFPRMLSIEHAARLARGPVTAPESDGAGR